MHVLFQWAEVNPHPELDLEVDCTSQDPNGYTPLMRACYGGNRGIALKVYNKNPRMLKQNNAKGESCFAIAKTSGHPDIATVLECLEAARLIEAKSSSYLTITPQKAEQKTFGEFVRPFDISISKSRTKSLDDHRYSPSSQNRCLMKLRSSSPFFSSSSGSSSPVQPLTISVEQQQQQQQQQQVQNKPPSSTILMSSGGRKQLYKRASFDQLVLNKSNRELQKSHK
jgi:hypothetical protein